MSFREKLIRECVLIVRQAEQINPLAMIFLVCLVFMVVGVFFLGLHA